MSLITDVVIVTIGGDDKAVATINEWLLENDQRKPQLLKLDAGKAGAGGTKASSLFLYAAAFNFVDVSGLEEAIRRAPWRCPSSIAAYFNGEMGSAYVMSPARAWSWKLDEDDL